MIKLYVIVVTCNMLSGLDKTLFSLSELSKSQSQYDIKAIVVNGRDNDDGISIINKYINIIYKYVAEKDRGIYDAMNKGINLLPVDGYSIFINSDDCLLSIPEELDREKFDVLFSNVISHDLDSDYKQVFRVAESKNLYASNLLRPRLHHQGCFVRSEILKKYRFDLEVGIRADVLMMGLLLNNHRSIFSNEATSIITTGGQSDVYSFTNFISFFRVADRLNINRINLIFLSFPEIIKYCIKAVVGKKGLYVVRRIKKLIF